MTNFLLCYDARSSVCFQKKYSTLVSVFHPDWAYQMGEMEFNILEEADM